MPHDGADLSPGLAGRMTAAGRAVADTDWHVSRLYGFLDNWPVTTLSACLSRYVIDLNRPADGQPLYPGQDETGLCPTTTFAHEDIYLPGQAPDDLEILERVDRYWRPYHQALRRELDRIVDQHGFALLWEAHSIRSVVPRFFQGQLTDLNLGSDNGRTCDSGILASLASLIENDGRYSVAVNGRFKGGYITRSYGQPGVGVSAIQLELAQCNYMQESSPFTYRQELAANLQSLLQRLLQSWLDLAASPV
jgi:N-formylglutamate deformylase